MVNLSANLTAGTAAIEAAVGAIATGGCTSSSDLTTLSNNLANDVTALETFVQNAISDYWRKVCSKDFG
jgi:hypothetical protein